MPTLTPFLLHRSSCARTRISPEHVTIFPQRMCYAVDMDPNYEQFTEPEEKPKEMKAEEVLDLLSVFEAAGIEVWIDGGWGVDALLGEQTRPHSDLDIALQHKDVPKLRELLEARGCRDVPRDDTWECNFVLGDARGQEVDIHSFTLNAAGNNVYGVEYPADSLTGTGFINGHPVKCISVEWMVKFHTGYPLDEDDFRDVYALHERFGVPLPDEYIR